MKGFSDKLNALVQYLKYQSASKHWRGHGVHSPCVFEFTRKVLFDRTKYSDYNKMNAVTKALKKTKLEVEVIELGGGSRVFSKESRSVSSMLKLSSVRKKYGRLLYRIAKFYEPSNVVELGTSLGISSLFLAIGNKNGRVFTIEGNKPLIEIAQSNCKKLKVENISFIHGNFDSELPEILDYIGGVELAFIDGNHTYEATLTAYKLIRSHMKKGFLIFDDIYWSVGMQKAWEAIKEREHVCIDLYQFGIVIIGEQLTPGDYQIRY